MYQTLLGKVCDTDIWGKDKIQLVSNAINGMNDTSMYKKQNFLVSVKIKLKNRHDWTLIVKTQPPTWLYVLVCLCIMTLASSVTTNFWGQSTQSHTAGQFCNNEKSDRSTYSHNSRWILINCSCTIISTSSESHQNFWAKLMIEKIF